MSPTNSRLLQLSFALAAVASCTSAVSGATQTFTEEFSLENRVILDTAVLEPYWPPPDAWWSVDRNTQVVESIPQFNPSLGTLNMVELTVTGNGDFPWYATTDHWDSAFMMSTGSARVGARIPGLAERSAQEETELYLYSPPAIGNLTPTLLWEEDFSPATRFVGTQFWYMEVFTHLFAGTDYDYTYIDVGLANNGDFEGQIVVTYDYTPGGSLMAAVIPEPAGLGFLLAAAATGLTRRRR